MNRTLQFALFVCLLGLVSSSALAQNPPRSKRLPSAKGAAPRQQQQLQEMPPQGPGSVHRRGDRGPGAGMGAPGMGRARGPHVGEWLSEHHNLSPQEQEQQLRSDPNFQNLPPEIQDRLLRRLRHFNSLSPEEQQLMLQRMRKFERLTPGQRDQLRQLQQGMHDLPEERREALHQTIHHLRTLSPQDRQSFMQSDSFRNSFNQREQELIRGWNDLDLATETQQPNRAPEAPDGGGGPDDGPHFYF